MSRLIDLTGQRFGMLTVLPYAGKSKHKHTIWLCKCDCGNEKVIDGQHLKQGNTRSCGCLEKYNRSIFGTRSKRTHQMKNTRIYHIWQGAKNRVFNKNDEHWLAYGGRGITMCKEWATSFEHFCAWAFANGYSENLTIDRIDVNGNYCPENCRWVTNAEQQRNKRNNRYYTYNGKTQLIPAWAKEFGVTDSTIRSRIRRGIPPEKVFFELSKQVV